MASKFAHSHENPYHLSVGAVVQRETGEILCHHIAPHTHGIGDFELFLLMRETVEDNESLEAAVERGLAEEFGVTASLIRFLGSEKGLFYHEATQAEIEKTTLYFLMRYEGDLPGGRTTTDPHEQESKLAWKPISFFFEQGPEQGRLSGRGDLDESPILRRV